MGLTISLGGVSHLALIEIDWELPPKSFEVQASTGGAYSVLYSTQVNSLNTTVVVAGGASAASLRLRMREPHPVWCHWRRFRVRDQGRARHWLIGRRCGSRLCGSSCKRRRQGQVLYGFRSSAGPLPGRRRPGVCRASDKSG